MEKKEEKEAVRIVPGKTVSDGFGTPVVIPDRPVRRRDPNRGFMITYGIRPCKDDPTRTEVYEAKRENIHEIIQVNADKVGIKAMLKAVQLGEVTLNSLADDGQGGVDDRLFSGFVPPLSALNEASKQTIKEYQEKIPGLNAENFEQLITDLVNKKIEEAKAAQNNNPKESE